MAIPEKDLRLIRKKFEDKNEKIPDIIRLGNQFVDDFIFEDHEAADIPINALRVIFNIISVIGGLIVLIMCLVMKSDPTENEYGVPADQIEKSRSIPVESRRRFDRD